MAKYTYYIVTRSADHHYPVLMANNGKQALNEPVKRRYDLNRAVHKLLIASESYEVDVVEIAEADFKKKFPQFAKNSGPKKLLSLTKKHKRDPLSKSFDEAGALKHTASLTKKK
jgi:hypothetical protein